MDVANKQSKKDKECDTRIECLDFKMSLRQNMES